MATMARCVVDAGILNCQCNAALMQLILLLVASSWLVPWYGSQRWLHVL
jgi:hypothetical protein